VRHKTLSERALVLAPRGRNAEIAASLLIEAGIDAKVCSSLPMVIHELDAGAGFVLVSEEALATADLAPLNAWMAAQEEWSDLPFVLLTNRGGGLERNPAARRFLDVLGNVTFLERPFHPTTLVSLANSALRGRRRQYEARSRLEALQAGEQKYRSLFEAIDAGFCIIEVRFDESGRQALDYCFLEVNPAFERQTGLVDAEGRWMRDLAPDHEQHWFDIYGQVALTGKPVRFDQTAQSLGRYFDVHAFRVGDAKARRVAILFNDITARRQMEERLRESEDHYRHTVELNPQVTWTAKPDGQLDHVARRWLDWTGTTGLGATWAGGLHEDDRERTSAVWSHSVTTGEPYDVEHRVKMRDGQHRWARSRAYPRRDDQGRIVKWYGTTQDIHEQKLAEARLAASEARFQAIANSIDQMIWSTLPDGFHDYYNQRWYDYTGVPEGSTDGEAWNGMFHPDDQERAWATWRHSLKTGEPYHIEYRLRHRSGQYRWVLGRAQCVRDESGAITRWFGTCTDIQDIVEAREVLTRSREELESLVAERTAKLMAAEEQLRQAQKMEAVGQLTGGVAHDFNNLLTIIKSSTDLLRRPDVTDERRRRYVDAISDTVDRAAKLTGQLLAFARRQALKPEVFDVTERLHAITDMLRTIVGSRVQIVTEIVAEACFVEADLSQFETALINMAVNARDAMDGEGTLTIEVATMAGTALPREAAASSGEFVAVSLTDTGSGIAHDKLAQIFEPFFTTKEVGKGTGLGLSQVYGFAKQSGGDVVAESEPGRGARFTLYLPRVEGAAAAAVIDEARQPARADRGRGRRVLVVEDNVDVGTFSTQLLADLGYETTWAANADDALKVLSEANGFDAVFSDVVMPGMSGVELGQLIRRLYPDLPVVLTSGYSHVLAEEGRHGFELLQKPYAAEDLSRVLRRVTQPRRAGRNDMPRTS
jgi:PAS domain S-box-containing protein